MADIEDIISGAEPRFIEADGQARVCFVVRCEHAGCDHELLVPRPQLKGGATREKAAKTPAFVRVIEHAMERADWTFRRNRARPLCADHHPRLIYAKKETALPVDPRPNGATPLPGPPLAAQPEQPRQPSRADNLRISDELDAAYDRDAGRYKGDCSDEKVAKKLAVPRLWVSTIRKGFFGDEDRNEAAEDDKAISAAMDLLAEADGKAKAAQDLATRATQTATDAADSVKRARAMLDGVRRGR